MKSAQQSTPSAIDHLGVVGRDIAVLTKAYTRLGFAPTEPGPLMGEQGGKLAPLGQDSAHLIFADSYVELAGVTSQDKGHHLAPWLTRRNGLHILALGSASAADSHAALTAAGLEVPPVQNAGRYVDYGNRHGDAQFRWFKVPEALGAEGFLCVVEQVTPDLVFQPPEDEHPNGALGVISIIVLAADAAAATARYASLPGAQNGSAGVVRLGSQTIEIVNPQTLGTRYPGTVSITAPALAGFTVRVNRLDHTRACLEDNGVAVRSTEEGGLWVGPDEACGSLVIFAED